MSMLFTLLSTAQFIFDSVGAQKCYAPANTLTTSCNKACGSYEPCLVYNSTECSNSGSNAITENCTNDFDVCSYTCFQAFGAYNSNPIQFVFLVSFGMEDVNSDAIYATANVTAIDQLMLSPQTTDAWIQGGDYQQINKGKVVELELANNLLTSQSQVTSVSLMRMNLSARNYDIPYMIPSTTTSLSLSNTLLMEFPSHLTSLSSIMTLHLNDNYITTVGSSVNWEKLTALNLYQNNVTTFEGNFPGLNELYLNSNNLTEIPAIVFTFEHLTKFAIQNNPLTSRTFIESQIKFLQGLASFDLIDSDFQNAVNCSFAEQRMVGDNSVVVCVSDFASSPGSTSEAFSDTSLSSGNSPVSRISYSSGSTSVDNDHSSSADRTNLTLIVAIVATIVVLIALTATATYHWKQHTHEKARGVYNNLSRSSSKRRATELWDDHDLLQLQVNCDDIQDIRAIGGGASTTVWLIRYRSSVLLVSKRLREDVISTERTQDFVEEIRLASKLDHPNIVTLKGVAWSTRSDMQALFEFVENGDLNSYLAPSLPRYWTRVKLQLAVDVIEALIYVHAFTPPMSHQGLNSRNVLISTDMQAKLADFVGSRFQSTNGGMDTNRWLAPEIISGSRHYGQSADIFAFGVLLSEFHTHVLPYDNITGESGSKLEDGTILQMVANGTLRPAFSDTCPPIILELAKQCMAQEPRDRPQALKIAYALRTLQREAFNL